MRGIASCVRVACVGYVCVLGCSSASDDQPSTASGGSANAGNAGRSSTGGGPSTGGTTGVGGSVGNAGAWSGTGGTGGNPGNTGGTGAGGGAEGRACSGNVLFTLGPDTFTQRGAFCVEQCARAWLSVRDTQGHEVAVFAACEGCEPCKFQTPVSAYTTYLWDGTLTGGPNCAPPGEYIAKMCGFKSQSASASAPNPEPGSEPLPKPSVRPLNSPPENPPVDCKPSTEQVCVEVRFRYPDDGYVGGQLKPN